jgi:hypothetical protein
MATSQPINSRRDMLSIFDDRLQNNHSELVERARLNPGENMLKTAIIESNITPDDIFSRTAIEETHQVEDNLYMIEWRTSSSGSGWLFLDSHDERFWILYSLGDSKYFGDATSELISKEGAGLDRLWLPTAQVEEIGEMGEYESIKTNYSANNVFPEELIEDNRQFSDLSIDGSGQNSKRLYDLLRSVEDIDNYLALSRIQIRREINGRFVRERITNEGMFTTRGGSGINLHTSTVEQIKNRYADLLQLIEENHIVGATAEEHGARAQGAPIVIKFSHEVPDLESFISNVVNAQNPFRLWGHIRQVSKAGFKVDGVDMHNGDKIAIEASPSWLRLYLYDEACGNTALRLFTNIQQYYDPAADLVLRDRPEREVVNEE